MNEKQENCEENCVWNYDNGTNNRCNNGFVCEDGELYLSNNIWELDGFMNPVKIIKHKKTQEEVIKGLAKDSLTYKWTLGYKPLFKSCSFCIHVQSHELLCEDCLIDPLLCHANTNRRSLIDLFVEKYGIGATVDDMSNVDYEIMIKGLTELAIDGKLSLMTRFKIKRLLKK